MTRPINLQKGSLLLVFICMAVAVYARPNARNGAAGKLRPAADQSKKYVRPSDPSLYAGSETCKTCHEEMYKNFETTPHFATTLDSKKGPEWHGCEACHGPGKEHVEGGGDKSKIFTFKGASAQDSSARCLDCHSPHHALEKQYLMKEQQPQVCYGCHLEVKPDFSRAFHHRVNEGLIACSNCHNPHGGFLTRQLRSTAAQDLVCFNCHTDKAGPFAFEHAAVKTEGCVACHAPHGSSNPRLLKRSNINLLCMECHTLTVDSAAPAIPSFHNQAQKYQACTLCHVAVHGSNSDRFLFKP
jgi:predicted CXXCH cytochrome family protein